MATPKVQCSQQCHRGVTVVTTLHALSLRISREVNSMVIIKQPPNVSLEAFELYHECVSSIGVFFLPLDKAGGLRVWCFDVLRSQVPWNKIQRHKIALHALSVSCQLPFPQWLVSAMRHNRGYMPTDDELEQVFSAMSFRLGVTIDSVRMLAV